MVKERNYEKEALIAIIISLVFIVLDFKGIKIVPDGKAPIIWIGSAIVVVLVKLIRKETLKELEFLIVPILIFINYILFRNHIYIPNYIVIYVAMSALIIYYLYRSTTKWRIYKITGITVLVVGLLSLSYYMYTNRNIKDRSLGKYIKNEFGIEDTIREEDVRDIEELFISESDNVVSIEGIHNFKNLKKLHLWGAHTIIDFSPLKKLDNLERLMTWNMNLDKLDEIEKITSLKDLEILYPKSGRINNLEKFPNLKVFWVQGLSFKDLRGLRGPKNLETLHINNGEIESFKGIDMFPKLKELNLYKVSVKDISQIYNLEQLEKIELNGVHIQNQHKFEQIIKERGIELIKTETLDILM